MTASKPALALAATLIVLPSAASVVQFDRIASATDNRVIVADWFARHVPPGDSVLQSGSIYGYAQIDNRVWTVWTWDRYRKAFMVQDRRAAGRPDWILLQESPLPSMTQDVVAGSSRRATRRLAVHRFFTARRPCLRSAGRVLHPVHRILGRHAPRAELHALQAHNRQPDK